VQKKLLLPIIMFLASCGSTQVKQPVKLDYIDLSKPEQVELVEQYWTNVQRVEPIFPTSEARNHISGCVDLIVGINSQGKVQGYQISSSYPKRIFDNAASTALSKWQWQATAQNKARLPVLTSVRLDFRSQKNPSADYLEHCSN